MKNSICWVLILALLILLSGCIQNVQLVPKEGIWHCEELGITVDFESEKCFVLIDGVEINSSFRNNRGSNFISVSNQDTIIEDLHLGEILFSGECIRYDDTTMVISEYRTEIIYTFYKIDTPTS